MRTEIARKSVKAEGSLTGRLTSRADTKVGLSDPVESEWKCHRSTDKSYPGDNRLISVRSKGWAVRPLKRYASWVQNVVRQFGPYLSQAEDI